VLAGAGSRAALRLAADRVLLTDAAGEVRTGRSLGERTEALARALTALGLRDRRVGLWYWNSVAAIEAHLAGEWIGATKVPVDPGAPTAEARAVFEAAAVDAVLTDAAHQDLPGAHLHDTHQPLAVPGPTRTPGTLEAVRVPTDRTAVLYPRMATAAGLFAVPISFGNWEAGIRNNVALYRSSGYGPGFDGHEVFVTAQQLPTAPASSGPSRSCTRACPRSCCNASTAAPPAPPRRSPRPTTASARSWSSSTGGSRVAGPCRC
jgi:acyl-CoA synthetase (AMP-forming)/AMP-acid ligase II